MSELSTSASDTGTTDVEVSSGFPNPGLPPHRPRLTDVDSTAERRAERTVATLFTMSIAGTLATIAAYVAFSIDDNTSMVEHLNDVRVSTLALGLGMFVSLLCIGLGAVHWAKTLMPDTEHVEERHALSGSTEDRADAVEIINLGADESGIGRRPLIRNTFIGALALAPLPAVVLMRDLGPLPEHDLATTLWKPGMALVKDPILHEGDQGKIRPEDLDQGSIVHVMPEGIEKADHVLEEKAKAAVLLLRLDPSKLSPDSLAGSYYGIVAYSKICTHMGCPVALYEQQTHHLLCPCHQSTFDLTNNCEVIFGPAKRALPQLPLTVNDEGYLVAKSGFSEPVGPSYWERS